MDAYTVTCDRIERGRVRLRTELELPLSVGQVWSFIAAAETFLTIDPFHEQVQFQGPVMKPGVGLVIVHNVFGVRLRRVGRVLRLQAGRGYAFSDLSRRGADRGFPHVFVIELIPLDGSDTGRTRLSIEVRGKWTARWIPSAIARRWLMAVGAAHARLLREAILGKGRRDHGR